MEQQTHSQLDTNQKYMSVYSFSVLCLKQLLLLILVGNLSYAQSTIQQVNEDRPEKAQIISTDIANFWIAFDSTFSHPQGNEFESFYIKNGSQGVKAFLKDRIVNADTLLATVKRRRNDYEQIRNKTLEIQGAEKQIRAGYYAFKYLYTKAKFPPLYFVIGRFNSGGTATARAQIIGAEMNDVNSVSYLVAHELIHANQNIPYTYKILLEQCIIEGSADFLGELISGKVTPYTPYEYAKGKEKELWLEFVKDMNLGENDGFSYWLYGGERKDSRPADMGYYIGYVITKAYYDKALDKKKAIEEILNIQDCKRFLKESGYGEQFSTIREQTTIQVAANELVSVRFECENCSVKNKITLAGRENYVFTNSQFPFKQSLKPGAYTLTYWQNKVRQMHFSFAVTPHAPNLIRIK